MPLVHVKCQEESLGPEAHRLPLLYWAGCRQTFRCQCGRLQLCGCIWANEAQGCIQISGAAPGQPHKISLLLRARQDVRRSAYIDRSILCSTPKVCASTWHWPSICLKATRLIPLWRTPVQKMRPPFIKVNLHDEKESRPGSVTIRKYLCAMRMVDRGICGSVQRWYTPVLLSVGPLRHPLRVGVCCSRVPQLVRATKTFTGYA